MANGSWDEENPFESSNNANGPSKLKSDVKTAKRRIGIVEFLVIVGLLILLCFLLLPTVRT